MRIRNNKGEQVKPPIDNLYWTPGTSNGFLPMQVPLVADQFSKAQHSALKWLFSLASHVYEFSDTRLSEEIDRAQVCSSDLLEEMPTEACEGLLRCYVFVASHRIHRPVFSLNPWLPPALAVPIWKLSQRLGRPPALTYASYVLANLQKMPSVMGPIECIELAGTLSGTRDEEIFIAAHLAVESAGGMVVEAIDQIRVGIETKADAPVITGLKTIAKVMQFSTSVISSIVDEMDPHVFRTQIRPWLYGFSKIVFRGVPGNPSVDYVGETGAQSGVIRAVDAILGIHHSDVTSVAMKRFLACAPPPHQEYIMGVNRLGAALKLRAEELAVKVAYQSTIAAVADFRKAHWGVVSQFLLPEGRPLVERGTGGTDYTKFLPDLIAETEAE
ncbi:MAG TPA: hypothetical protein VGM98_14380 [Schlesneria sp.]|jgi:indoleamine 2,3-dioxygenase